MLLKVLLYGYSVGVTSSRALERSCVDDVACRYLGANQVPDYRSVVRFRRRHLKAMDSLFTQVLAGCAMGGLVRLGRVALDGTKLRASASRHKAMSYDHHGAAPAGAAGSSAGAAGGGGGEGQGGGPPPWEAQSG
jgi:transposase